MTTMTKPRRYTKSDAKLGGPGLDGYAYNADVYCVDCGRAIVDELEIPEGGWDWLTFQDSEEVPQPIFFGESDGAQHCAECGKHLYGPIDATENDE